MLVIVQEIDAYIFVMFQITIWMQECFDWFFIIARQDRFHHMLRVFKMNNFH